LVVQLKASRLAYAVVALLLRPRTYLHVVLSRQTLTRLVE